MSKSDTNKKWVSTDEYKSNYDRIFNTPKEEDEVFDGKPPRSCICSNHEENVWEDGLVSCSRCDRILHRP